MYFFLGYGSVGRIISTSLSPVLKGLLYFHEQHLLSCVCPLCVCYRVLNMGREVIFDVLGSLLRR